MTPEKKAIALELLAKGEMTNEKIASIVGVSTGTISRYHRQIRDSEDFQKLVRENEHDFIKLADEIIESGTKVLARFIAETANYEKLDQRTAQTISNIVGTIYDKKALATGKATSIVDGQVNVTRFEDM
jgi:predicted transcriptional regulator